MKHRILKSTSFQKRGVALLIAVLMMSVTLAVGLGVYQRTYKELYFSSFWKQTQIAITAADGGLECGLYWDLHPSASPACFNTTITTWVAAAAGATYTDSGALSFSSYPTPQCPCDTGGTYECNPGGAAGVTFNGTDVGPVCYDQWSGGIPSRIWNRTAAGGASGMPAGSFQLDTNNGCVKVTISKPAPLPSTLGTHIEARGYNATCVAVTAATNPRIVERGLYLEY